MLGREAERASIEAMLTRARRSESAVVRLVGEPGVGKSAICDYAAARASGMQVLRGVGLEWESDFPYAGVSEIVAPLHDRVAELVPAHRDALRALLGEAGQPGPDPFALAGGTLALLSLAAASRPVLVVVDDTQWLDHASGALLSFVFRRLNHDAVAVLLGTRSGERCPLGDTWETIALGGLEPAAAQQLLVDAASRPVARDVASELAERTSGNPLALIELAAELSPLVLAGRHPLPDPLPLGTRGVVSFGHQLARLPAATLAALAILAAAGPAPFSVTAAALERAGLGVSDLLPAETTRVLRQRDGALRFAHPLVRAAAFASVTGEQQRCAHQLLAEVTPDVERRAWHLAAATLGPSEEVAEALEAAAEQARRRGGAPAAAPALARAAQLSPEGAARWPRLLRAGEALFLGGDHDDAIVVLDELLRSPLDPSTRADALLLQARLAHWTGSLDDVLRGLRASFEELRAAGDERAIGIGMIRVTLLSSAGRNVEGVELAAQVRDLVAPSSPWRLPVEVMHATAALIRGNPTWAIALEPQLDDLEVRPEDLDTWGFVVAQLRCWTDHHVAAEEMLQHQVALATARSAMRLLPVPLTILAEVQVKRGHLIRARASADRAILLSRECILPGVETYARAVRARVAALEGDAGTCRAEGRAALERSQVTDQRVIGLYVNQAWGLLELGHGHPGRAVEHLEANVELWPACGAVLPNVVPWQGDYVHALLATVERARAERALEELEAASDRTQSRWGRSVALRGRAMMVPACGTELLEEAISLQQDMPIERGRSLLVLGDHLRRSAHVADARRALADAAELLWSSGARPWAEKADSLLRTTGIRREHPGTGVPKLTEQELQVALLIADGATNKEASAALYLSAKTVEYHLGKAFRKLGVSNRTQLAAKLRAG